MIRNYLTLKGDNCYAIRPNEKVVKKNKIEHSYTTQYYYTTFIHKDLRKKQIQVKYTNGTDGHTYTLPTYATIYA